MKSLPPRLRSAVATWIAIVVLTAPVGVALSLFYRAAFALGAWALGSPYPPDELEFLSPQRVWGAVLWTYVICGVPTIATAFALAWRTWQRSKFEYIYAAIIAATFMTIYMAAAAYVYRRTLVRVVTVESAVSGVVYAAVVSVVITALLRRLGIAKCAKD
jgi:hypothetical protein